MDRYAALPLTGRMYSCFFLENSILQKLQNFTIVLLIYCLTIWSIIKMNSLLLVENMAKSVFRLLVPLCAAQTLLSIQFAKLRRPLNKYPHAIEKN